MGENARARGPEEQAVTSGQPWELGHGHGREDWPDLLAEPCEPAQDMFELLQGKVAGHRWDGWRRLTGDEGYFAACSCGWRSRETGGVSPMLCQVKEHLEAVGAVRGWRASALTAQAPGRDEREHRAGQRGMRVPLQSVVTWSDLRVSVTRLRGPVVLADHAAEHLRRRTGAARADGPQARHC